jgi:hypothetical protein
VFRWKTISFGLISTAAVASFHGAVCCGGDGAAAAAVAPAVAPPAVARNRIPASSRCSKVYVVHTAGINAGNQAEIGTKRRDVQIKAVPCDLLFDLSCNFTVSALLTTKAHPTAYSSPQAWCMVQAEPRQTACSAARRRDYRETSKAQHYLYTNA